MKRDLPRRAVLAGGLGTVAAVGISACGGGHSHRSAGGTPTPTPTLSTTDDPVLSAVAAAAEGLLLAAYAAVSTRAAEGTYGPLSTSLTDLLAAASSHHRQHLAGWQRRLTQLGASPARGLASEPGTLTAVTATATLDDALSLLAGLEGQAAATYQQLVGARVAQASVALAATIAPVEAQHGAVLAILDGSPPSLPSFGTGTGAFRASMLVH